MSTYKKIQLTMAGCASALLLMMMPTQADSATTSADAAQGVAGMLKVIGAYPEERGVGHSVTGLANGQILVYGHSPDISALDSVRLSPKGRTGAAAQLPPLLWDPQQRGWQQLPNPPECTYSHYLHTSTALASGKVLIAGGLCDPPRRHANVDVAPPYRALSVWNNVSHSWEKAAQLAAARIYHSATLLADDSVLLAGGESDRRDDEKVEPVLASTELWRDGKIVPGAPMIIPRAKHSATRLADGSVLVAGGIGREGKAITFVERWDPATQRWSYLPEMGTARSQHSAILLDDGRLMVAGGFGSDGKPLASVEILDAARSSWSAGAPLLKPLHRLAAQVLPGGDVLVVGTGKDGEHSYADALLWSKTSAEWRPAGRPFSDRYREQQTYALVPAAPNSSAVLVFDFRLVMRWTPSQQGPGAGSVYGERSGYTSTVLKDGRVMLAAGRIARFGSAMGETGVDWVELYQPANDRFALTGRLNEAKVNPVARALADGGAVLADVDAIVMAGERKRSLAEAWNPLTGRWNSIPGLTADWPTLQIDAFGQLDDGRVLFYLTGLLEHDMGNAAKIWNPRDNSVETLAPPIKGIAAAVASNGQVLIMPWNAGNETQAQVWDIRSGRLEPLKTPDGLPLDHAEATLLKNGSVVLAPRRHASNVRGGRLMVWTPAAHRLLGLPALPGDFFWDNDTRQLIELFDGTLATDGYRLRPDAPAWTVAPPAPQEWTRLAALPSGQLLALSVAGPYTAYMDLATGDWRLQSSHFLRRKETMAPALLQLSDGQLMVAGSFDRSGWSQQTTMQLWNPGTGAWTDGYRPLGVYVAQLQAVGLPSGQVMLLGRDRDANLGCEIGHPREMQWQACGPSTPVNRGDTQFTVGTLDDGRVALMFGQTNAYVYSEQTRQWAALPAPLPAMKPAGSGVTTARVALPDGCAISGPPFRIYDPKTQSETPLTLATGVKALHSSMTVLSDGTVVQAGYPEGASELGAGFFHRKASCAGWAALDDDALQMPGTVAALIAPSVAARSGLNFFAGAGVQIWAAKWWIVTVLAALSALWLYWRERQRVQQADALRDPRLKDLVASAPVRSDWQRTSAPAADKGPGRALLYFGAGVAVVFLLLVRPGPMARWFGNADTSQPCRLVGVWLSSRAGSEITLNADGSYITALMTDERGMEQIYHGKWKVSGDKMIWTHYGKETVTEANPIKEESEGHFTLIEENGDQTRFTLQKTVASGGRCTQ
jgi:hypothetical protein